jgi:hypothetical protein
LSKEGGVWQIREYLIISLVTKFKFLIYVRYQTVNISITFGSDFGKIKDLKHKLEI